MADETDARTRLLDAARDIVAERGWGAATSRAVAERANANLALINYYFGSKNDLLLATLDRSMTAMAEAATNSGEGLDGLLAHAIDFTETQAESPDVGVLFAATLEAAHNPGVAAAVRGHLGAFRAYAQAAVAQAIRDKRLPKRTDAAALGNAIAALLDGLLLHAVIDPDVDVPAALKAAVRAISE